jgi:hypothetical protein
MSSNNLIILNKVPIAEQSKRLVRLFTQIKIEFVNYVLTKKLSTLYHLYAVIQLFITTIKEYYATLMIIFHTKLEKAEKGLSPVIISHAKRSISSIDDIYTSCLLCIKAIGHILKNNLNLNNIKPFSICIQKQIYSCSSLHQLFDIFSAKIVRLSKIYL